jgi:hypothetical protein
MRRSRTFTAPSTLTPAEVEDLVSKLAAFAAQARLVLLYLHGAHARGEQGPLSDIDVAVLLEGDGRGTEAYLDILESLQRLSGRDDIDLVVLNTAGSIIKDRVARHGRLVYQRSAKDRVLFEARAIKEAMDFQRFSREYDDALFKQLAEGRFLD